MGSWRRLRNEAWPLALHKPPLQALHFNNPLGRSVPSQGGMSDDSPSTVRYLACVLACVRASKLSAAERVM